MKFRKYVMFLLLALAWSGQVEAQDDKLTQTADVLRLRLIEAQAKEAELRIRLEQLDEDLKPETIERALAGIGSTRPEDLRAQLRRFLMIEKSNTIAQLKVVELNRSRLEAAIATAEAQSYQQIAEPTPGVSNQVILTTSFADVVRAILPISLIGLTGVAIFSWRVVKLLNPNARVGK